MSKRVIDVQGAYLHNLREVSFQLPKEKLIVVTGVSGSGKSSIVFDTIHKEGQRQYVESLGLTTDGLQRPSVKKITGLSPSIAVRQSYSNHSPRSTVGTVTEIYTYIRVLFARIGRRKCSRCGQMVSTPQDMAPEFESDDATVETDKVFPCSNCGAPLPLWSMTTFSFNKPQGACDSCSGLGHSQSPNMPAIFDMERSIAEGGVKVWTSDLSNHYGRILSNASRRYGFEFSSKQRIKDLTPEAMDLLLYGAWSDEFCIHYPQIPKPTRVADGNFEGVLTKLLRNYAEKINDIDEREELEQYFVTRECVACHGKRLKPEILAVSIADVTFREIVEMSFVDLIKWLRGLKSALSKPEFQVAEPIVNDLVDRVGRVVDVGVGYLTMSRASNSLSGGESQRLRLAALLGSGLTGVIYVLDEPTTGLHPRDNDALIRTLRHLRDLGNTVLVIEHDMDIVAAADHIVEVGPGAGSNGGRIMANDAIDVVKRDPQTLTGQYFSGSLAIRVPQRRPLDPDRAIVIRNASEHNLKNVDIRIPIGGLVGFTGVSGSGKSTVVMDILERAARKHFSRSNDVVGAHDEIMGLEQLGGVIAVDQIPASKSTRSNAATYTDAFGSIRELYGSLSKSIAASHFSFNVPGGRCEKCKGMGDLAIKMHFLPEVYVTCSVCKGKRFQPHVLDVRYKGLSISDVLDSTIDEAYVVFEGETAIFKKLSLLRDVGLGYLRLGQPAATLSGGEIQRVKLAKELSRKSRAHMLYILDEPSIGLHVSDVQRLIHVLQRLVDAGNTVVVIEHNADVIKSCDWLIDMGPEGGERGGEIIACGPPEVIARSANSHTGRYLSTVLT
jgi:excinuclease ABC subunit A